MEPMLLRHVPFGDGDEARQPRFRRQQIVVRAIGAPWAIGVGQAVSDREHAAPAVVQELEPHRIGQQRRAARQPA